MINIYGHKDINGVGVVSEHELNRILYSFKPLLEKVGLWTKKPKTFARNTLLLGDLFQNQSNGDMSLNADEATEYAVIAIHAHKLATQVRERLRVEGCKPVPVDGNFGYWLNCYRPKFFKILFVNSRTCKIIIIKL